MDNKDSTDNVVNITTYTRTDKLRENTSSTSPSLPSYLRKPGIPYFAWKDPKVYKMSDLKNFNLGVLIP